MATPLTPPFQASRTDDDGTAALQAALRTLEIEADGLNALKSALATALAGAFIESVRLIGRARGRVIVSGMGKSGHVGQKIAATLASTGTPAFFVHPSEAGHGDLGMIQPQDVIITFSWSGETTELRPIVDYSRRFAVPLIAVTSNPASTLAQAADVVLALPRVAEACPHGLAPTTSTLLQLALGDALAITLLRAKGFTAKDFKIFHPGGQLGANLKFVSDVMHTGARLPLIAHGATMAEALLTMTEKSFGCIGVTARDGRLEGIITDGDLRRHMHADLLSRPVQDIMTPAPKTIVPDMLVSAALEILNSSQITAIFAVQDRKPVGIVHIHDLLRVGVA